MAPGRLLSRRGVNGRRRRRKLRDLSHGVGYNTVMESTANLQVTRHRVRLENARLQRERLQRRYEEDRGERRIPSAQIVPIPAVCSVCGEAVEIQRGLGRVCDPNTFDQHFCAVRRAS